MKINKKGNITDVPFIALMLFFSAFCIIIALLLIHSITAQFNVASLPVQDINTGVVVDAMDAASNVTGSYESKAVPLWDGIFLVVFVALALAAIISAYFIDANPILFPVAVILIIGFVIFVNILESVFASFIADPLLSSYASQFTIIPYFMSHLTVIITILAFVIAIVLYSKFKGAGQ